MVDESEGDYEHFNIIADPGQAALRIDKFLLDKLPNISRSKIALAAKNGNVLANGERVKQNYKVRPEDEILWYSHIQKGILKCWQKTFLLISCMKMTR